MKVDLAMLKTVVYDGGKILKNYYERGVDVSYKGPRDLVTEADIKVEEYIKERLCSLYPEVLFLGEETGGMAEKPCTFILDPLDGTTNFAHHFPFFCISLAYIQESQIEIGIVYDPLRDEMFYAKNGDGAFLNGKRISVSNTDSLQKALLATGFPYANDTIEKSLSYFNGILPFCQGIRRAGAAALDLVYTACGRFDGFFELNLKPWDVAAGILIVREGGGLVTDLTGKASTPYDGNILASNGLIHHEILRIVDKVNTHFSEFSELFRRTIFGKD